jgi:hypothetical protein
MGQARALWEKVLSGGLTPGVIAAAKKEQSQQFPDLIFFRNLPI